MDSKKPEQPRTQTEKVVEKAEEAAERVRSTGLDGPPLIGADDIDPAELRKRNHPES